MKPDKMFGKNPVSNPEEMLVVEQHNLFNQMHSAIKHHANKKDGWKQHLVR